MVRPHCQTINNGRQLNILSKAEEMGLYTLSQFATLGANSFVKGHSAVTEIKRKIKFGEQQHPRRRKYIY